MRVKGGSVTNRRRKKVLKAAKGFVHGRSKLYRLAKQATMKAGQHAYVGRKIKKRQFRSLWIVRLNNALKNLGIRYNTFIAQKNKKLIILNRKVLSELAVNHPDIFKTVTDQVQGNNMVKRDTKKPVVEEEEVKDPVKSKAEPAAKEEKEAVATK